MCWINNWINEINKLTCLLQQKHAGHPAAAGRPVGRPATAGHATRHPVLSSQNPEPHGLPSVSAVSAPVCSFRPPSRSSMALLMSEVQHHQTISKH